MVNVDELMTDLVQAQSHADAYRWALDLTPKALRELADLAYVEFESDKPRKRTMAALVVVAGRGMDGADVEEMFSALQRPVPSALRRAFATV
jgi:hypothetical protein